MTGPAAGPWFTAVATRLGEAPLPSLDEVVAAVAAALDGATEDTGGDGPVLVGDANVLRSAVPGEAGRCAGVDLVPHPPLDVADLAARWGPTHPVGRSGAATVAFAGAPCLAVATLAGRTVGRLALRPGPPSPPPPADA